MTPPPGAGALAVAPDAAAPLPYDGLADAIANELRTPLTSLHAALTLLAARPDVATSAESAALMAIARRGTERLMRLVEDSLDIGDADAGRLQLTLGPVVPADLLAAVRARAERAVSLRAAPHRSVALEVAVCSDRAIHGDARRVQRVVEHLVDNALAAAPPGTTVRVTVCDAADRVRIAVEDAGPGLAPEQLARAFARFTRAPSADRRRSGGVGLGLALSHAVAAHHGGTLTIDSAPGRTVVACELPAWAASAEG